MDDTIDLLVTHIGQLCTMPAHDGGPQRGAALGDLGLLTDAGVAIHRGAIVEVGPSARLERTYAAQTVLDAGGMLVTPGLVDPHTHVVWAGDRADEFERRLAGATYQQIMAEGGGINRTVRETRAASRETLLAATRARLLTMLAHGTTTVECKTGYGLNTQTELALLDVICALDDELPLDLVPTFLGAHAVPPEYADDPDAYVALLVDEMLPAVAAWAAEHWPPGVFCDVFCEVGAFDLEQTRQILTAAQALGMPLKVHVDEFEPLGGARLAAELGAVSADHVVVTPDDEIEALGRSETIVVSLPCTPFGLGHTRYTPARRFLEAGAALAVATDCNPGTGWNENMQFVMALAARYLRLTPAEALAAATINAAHAVGRGDGVGSLEPGKQADLVIWRVPTYQHLSYRFGSNLVYTVIKDGRVVYAPHDGL
jgi:imidazolonepropionase